MNLEQVKDFFNNLEVDYNLDYFNVFLNELVQFSKYNDLDLHINITDKTNNNTRLIVDIEE